MNSKKITTQQKMFQKNNHEHEINHHTNNNNIQLGTREGGKRMRILKNKNPYIRVASRVFVISIVIFLLFEIVFTTIISTKENHLFCWNAGGGFSCSFIEVIISIVLHSLYYFFVIVIPVMTLSLVLTFLILFIKKRILKGD